MSYFLAIAGYNLFLTAAREDCLVSGRQFAKDRKELVRAWGVGTLWVSSALLEGPTSLSVRPLHLLGKYG